LIVVAPASGEARRFSDTWRSPHDLFARRLAARHYDILVNNAGPGMHGRFAELPLDDQLRMMRLNMESVSQLSQAYLRRAPVGSVAAARRPEDGDQRDGKEQPDLALAWAVAVCALARLYRRFLTDSARGR
jgi:NAD(P)-dependent dehydrogenase (short-subunit alcohol dehydrogenase family)